MCHTEIEREGALSPGLKTGAGFSLVLYDSVCICKRLRIGVFATRPIISQNGYLMATWERNSSFYLSLKFKHFHLANKKFFFHICLVSVFKTIFLLSKSIFHAQFFPLKFSSISNKFFFFLIINLTFPLEKKNLTFPKFRSNILMFFFANF